MSFLHPAKREMIDAGGRTAQSFGLNRLLGQIYVLLYLTRDAMSLDEIAQTLGVSKASVSISCRQLEAWGAVHRRWVKGDRRDFYVPERNFRQIIGQGLMPAIEKKLASAKVQIERSLNLLKQNGKHNDDRFLEERLREAESYRQKVDRLVRHPLLRRLL